MNAAPIAPRRRRLAAALIALAAPTVLAAAEPVRWQLNMTPGVTETAANAYRAHMIMLWICVIIGLIVFGAMAYSILRFRKSRGAVPDTSLTHSSRLELLWTAIPVVILVLSAWPATDMVIAQYNADRSAREAEMTVKITGYQWMWRYEYVGEDVAFISRLDRESDILRQNPHASRQQIEAKQHYLRDVDRPLVIPADTRVRFVLTADDVIHAWWVPALGWKQDAIPGVINEAWTEVKTPGTYRGVCAELCGKDHGFMPIVVKVVPKAEYQSWLGAQKAAAPAVAAPARPGPAKALAAAAASPGGAG